jgi:hypothetical protein
MQVHMSPNTSVITFPFSRVVRTNSNWDTAEVSQWIREHAKPNEFSLVFTLYIGTRLNCVVNTFYFEDERVYEMFILRWNDTFVAMEIPNDVFESRYV